MDNENTKDLDFLDTDDFDPADSFGGANNFGAYGFGTQSQAHDYLTQSQFTQPKNDLQDFTQSQVDHGESSSSDSVSQD